MAHLFLEVQKEKKFHGRSTEVAGDGEVKSGQRFETKLEVKVTRKLIMETPHSHGGVVNFSRIGLRDIDKYEFSRLESLQ